MTGPNEKIDIYFGGWYQRTTLHLTEIYDFFAHGTSRLELSKEKLTGLHNKLELDSVTRESGSLEYLQAKTKSGISIKYFEDGLYVLRISSTDIKKSEEMLFSYYKNVFEPAVSYIFSLGAPTPKILANISSKHPTVIGIKCNNLQDYKVDSAFGEVYNDIPSQDLVVYKTPEYIIIVSKRETRNIEELVEMLIFFREFKDQLEKYLNIHRKVWEDITSIKQTGKINGDEVIELRGKLDSYQMSIDLITNRINQMGAYIKTRQDIAKGAEVEDELVRLFQYKFDTLTNTLAYVKELWKMTSDYLKTAVALVVEVENKSVNVNLRTLQSITMIGVVAGILGYLTRSDLPKITFYGVVYLVLLFVLVLLANKLIAKVYMKKSYKIKFTERASNI
jgi:hypothetical protein